MCKFRSFNLLLFAFFYFLNGLYNIFGLVVVCFLFLHILLDAFQFLKILIINTLIFPTYSVKYFKKLGGWGKEITVSSLFNLHLFQIVLVGFFANYSQLSILAFAQSFFLLSYFIINKVVLFTRLLAQ